MPPALHPYKRQSSSFYQFRTYYTFVRARFRPCLICGSNTLLSFLLFPTLVPLPGHVKQAPASLGSTVEPFTTSERNQFKNHQDTLAAKNIIPSIPSLHRLPDPALCILAGQALTAPAIAQWPPPTCSSISTLIINHVSAEEPSRHAETALGMLLGKTFLSFISMMNPY